MMASFRDIAIQWYRRVFGAPAGSDIRDEGLVTVLDGNSAVALSGALIFTVGIIFGVVGISCLTDSLAGFNECDKTTGFHSSSDLGSVFCWRCDSWTVV